MGTEPRCPDVIVWVHGCPATWIVTTISAGEAHGLIARPVASVNPPADCEHCTLAPPASLLHVQPGGRASTRTAQLSSVWASAIPAQTSNPSSIAAGESLRAGELMMAKGGWI